MKHWKPDGPLDIFEASEGIMGGVSGSPIVIDDGSANGVVVCSSAFCPSIDEDGDRGGGPPLWLPICPVGCFPGCSVVAVRDLARPPVRSPVGADREAQRFAGQVQRASGLYGHSQPIWLTGRPLLRIRGGLLRGPRPWHCPLWGPPRQSPVP